MPVTIGKERLARILRTAGNLVTVDDAATALDTDRQTAAKMLSRWNEQGALKRIRRGLYAPIPPQSILQDQVLEEPLILIPEVFDPSYIGGWTATEHWDLTEQLFRSICVLTNRPVQHKKQTLQGLPFVLKHIRQELIFATVPLWKGRTKLHISDPHKTIVDILNDPAIGGGIQHCVLCVRNYYASEHYNSSRLIEYATRMNNGAILKRLGFIVEQLGIDNEFVKKCAGRLTMGNTKIDPALPATRLITKWRLWVPSSWYNLFTND